MTLKSFIKKMIPSPILGFYRYIRMLSSLLKRHFIFSYRNTICYKKIKRKYKVKGKLTVAFFALDRAIWKLDYLYKIIENDPTLKPIIIVCPIINFGHENMIKKMDECFSLLKNKGYNVIKAYDKEKQTYLNVRRDINPDIIFYLNPYKGLIDNRYYLDQFRDKLTCYIPYYYGENIDSQLSLNLPFHNDVWRFYVETPFHQELAKKTMKNKGNNVRLTGYPGTDLFLDKSYIPFDNWKIKDRKIKRIIWAPHQTIFNNDLVYFSCFLMYYDFMLEMASKYKDKIQIAFKPHPLLRTKLYTYWGIEKTEEYYNKWDSLDNGMIEEGAYADLFLTSDAMIHDSGSFIIEYLYTLKPVMRTQNEMDYKKQFNDFALECLNNYYFAYNENDIETFIVNLIDGIDSKKLERETFFKEKLLPINNQISSQNIYDNLIGEFK